MYQDIYERWVGYRVPFHQRVMHFNYDVPVSLLHIALEVILSNVPSDLFLISPDYFEYNGKMTDQKKQYKKHTILEKIEVLNDEYQCQNEMVKVGIFDKSLTFYLRFFIEKIENIGIDEEKVGNIELYSCDAFIFHIYKLLSSKMSAHILIESAKNFLDEIYFY